MKTMMTLLVMMLLGCAMPGAAGPGVVITPQKQVEKIEKPDQRAQLLAIAQKAASAMTGELRVACQEAQVGNCDKLSVVVDNIYLSTATNPPAMGFVVLSMIYEGVRPPRKSGYLFRWTGDKWAVFQDEYR